MLRFNQPKNVQNYKVQNQPIYEFFRPLLFLMHFLQTCNRISSCDRQNSIKQECLDSPDTMLISYKTQMPVNPIKDHLYYA